MITVITGPPCSGKSTWLRDHAKPGDIVIDFDDLAQALGSAQDHDHDPRIREVTAAAWAAAVRRAVESHQGARVWIIDSKPTTQRQRDYQRGRARTVALTATPAELHRRAADDRYRHKRIDEWFAKHDPAPTVRTRW